MTKKFWMKWRKIQAPAHAQLPKKLIAVRVPFGGLTRTVATPVPFAKKSASPASGGSSTMGQVLPLVFKATSDAN